MSTSNDNTEIQKVEYNLEGEKGWFVRGFNKEKREYQMIDSFFDKDLPRWIKDVKTPLVEGEGIPTALYLEIYLLKKLKVNPETLDRIMIFKVHELESIFQLHELKRNDTKTDLGILFKQTRLFKSRNNLLIQTGMRISQIKIIPEDGLFNHPNHLENQIPNTTSQEIENLCLKYKVAKDEMLFWNFNVEIILK